MAGNIYDESFVAILIKHKSYCILKSQIKLALLIMLIGADITPVLLTWDSFKSTTSFMCPDAGGYSCKPSISSQCVTSVYCVLIVILLGGMVYLTLPHLRMYPQFFT